MHIDWGLGKATLGSVAFSPVEATPAGGLYRTLLKRHAAADPYFLEDDGQGAETGEG
jgi:hypothetical protein